MRTWALLTAAALIVVPSGILAQTTAKPVAPTIAQLAARAKLSNVAVSPDGKHIAAMQARGEETVILVWNADALDKQPVVIGSSQMKIQGFDFIKDDRLAVALWQPYDFRGESVVKLFISKLFITDLEGKQWREAITLPRARSQAEEEDQARSSPSVLSTLPDDPDHILVVNSVGSSQGDVYRVDIRSGRTERIQRTEERVSGYRVDAAGNLRSRLRYDTDGNGAFTAVQFRSANGDWSEHFRSYAKDRDTTDVVGFIDDPNIAIVATNVGEDRVGLFEYDIAARKRGEQLFKHRYFNADNIRTWQMSGTPGIKRGEITAIGFAGPRGNDLVRVSPPLKAIDQAIKTALKIETAPLTFTDRTVNIVDTSRDLKTVIISDEPVNKPRSYYILRDGQLQSLGSSEPDLDARAFGETSFTYYKARDGRVIPAFLTKPNEQLCGAGPWRTVVMPHGGPWARDVLTFDYFKWVPLLASRCMAVLRPQYRGSDGWGRSLWKAGDAEWGQKMQDDKDDGVKWLIDQKIAIPGRVAMFGFSYGGYAAMAASVRPNGLYKCAIAGAGVSDIRRIWSRFYENPFFRQAQAPTVKGLSPVDKASEIKIPVMVYHGDRDQTVPIYQSEIFVSPAKRSGQPVEYHELKDFAHGPFWTVAVNAEQLTIIDNYLSKGCGGGGL
jgi:dipeptidyl aminopeptidase/acylaminoacyl peptidase